MWQSPSATRPRVEVGGRQGIGGATRLGDDDATFRTLSPCTSNTYCSSKLHASFTLDDRSSPSAGERCDELVIIHYSKYNSTTVDHNSHFIRRDGNGIFQKRKDNLVFYGRVRWHTQAVGWRREKLMFEGASTRVEVPSSHLPFSSSPPLVRHRATLKGLKTRFASFSTIEEVGTSVGWRDARRKEGSERRMGKETRVKGKANGGDER
jgi:hypothetical protein